MAKKLRSATELNKKQLRKQKILVILQERDRARADRNHADRITLYLREKIQLILNKNGGTSDIERRLTALLEETRVKGFIEMMESTLKTPFQFPIDKYISINGSGGGQVRRD